MTGGNLPVISLDKVAAGFKDNSITLFNDLNLKLWPGRLVCLMGPNGVGKSSLIRTIGGLQERLSGDINIAGVRKPSDIPKCISLVLTEKVTVANMTVTEYLTFGRYPYLDWKASLSTPDFKIIQDALSKVAITELADALVSTLSDGQLQLVMIARALVQDTPVILMDEPTAHLDLNHRLEVMKLLRGLTRNLNKAILISTHELDLALQIADEIWLAGTGRGITTGIPEDLVLSGAFDDVFQFKGFDLKTGKFHHTPFRQQTITLKGTGYYFLWTKNALERHGFTVETTDPPGSITIIIDENEADPTWHVVSAKRQEKTFSIETLISIVCALPE